MNHLSFNDFQTLQKKTHTETAIPSWIEKLVEEESKFQRQGIIHLDNAEDIVKSLDESSIEMMNRLKSSFDSFARTFNQLLESEEKIKEIKIFKISNTVNDFMLYRNSLKLVFLRRAADLIQISLIPSSLNGSGSLNIQQQSIDPVIDSMVELKAIMEHFETINWTYRGRSFSEEQLCKYFFTQFVRTSV